MLLLRTGETLVIKIGSLIRSLKPLLSQRKIVKNYYSNVK